MKKVILIIVLIFASFAIGYGAYLELSLKDNTSFAYQKIEKIDYCNLNDSECDINPGTYKSIITKGKKIKQVEIELKKENAITKDYFNKVRASNSCTNENSVKFLHSKTLFTFENLYHSRDIISIAISRTVNGLCDNTSVVTKFEPFIYDKRKNKILTTQEVLAKEGLTEEKVLKIVEKILKKEIKDEKISDVMKDVTENGKIKYVVFYDNKGNLDLSFQKQYSTYITNYTIEIKHKDK